MLNTTIKGIDLIFNTSRKVFSPKVIDEGTLAMLSEIDFESGDKVLDLGCGYGVVGILVAKLIGAENVIMVDIDQESVNLAKENAKLNGVSDITIYKSDGFNDFKEMNFTKIISNPPYHVDFSTPKYFIEKGFNRITMNGKMYMVTKREKWYKNKLISVFGGVKIVRKDDYFVFMSIKKSFKYSNKK